MRKENARKRKNNANPVPPAGMRADKRRQETGSALPDKDSLLEEMEWRREHSQ
ncbi:MAG: hypothetical protein VB078_04305 [Clostridiaceae bacterium]|nr:hypothetical protein [Clostridiaceae bacterium]